MSWWNRRIPKWSLDNEIKDTKRKCVWILSLFVFLGCYIFHWNYRKEEKKKGRHGYSELREMAGCKGTVDYEHHFFFSKVKARPSTRTNGGKLES